MMWTHVLMLLGFMLLLTSAVIADPEVDLRQRVEEGVFVPCDFPACTSAENSSYSACCMSDYGFIQCAKTRKCCPVCDKPLGIPCTSNLCENLDESVIKECCQSMDQYSICSTMQSCCPKCEKPKDICTDNKCAFGMLSKDEIKECCKYGKDHDTYLNCVNNYGCCPFCECAQTLVSIAINVGCYRTEEAYTNCTSTYDCSLECDSICDNDYCCEYGMFNTTGGYTDRYQECIDSKCRPSCECKNPPEGIELYECCREGMLKKGGNVTDAYLECQKKYDCSPSCDCPADELCPEELEKCCENAYTNAMCIRSHGCKPACDTLCDYTTCNDEKCCRHGMYQSGSSKFTDRYQKCSENGCSPCCECDFHVDEYTVEYCCRDGIFDQFGNYTQKYEDCIKSYACCVKCPCDNANSALDEKCCTHHHPPSEPHVHGIFHDIGECSRKELGCFPCCECKEPLDESSMQECCSEGMFKADGNYTDAYKRCQTKHGCCPCCECENLSDFETQSCCSDETLGCKYQYGCCPKCGSCVFDGLKYRNGESLYEKCLDITCENGTWTAATDINPDCGGCFVRDAPHIIPYKSLASNGIYYVWHGYCKYVLTQPGFNQMPPFGVFASFRPCFAGASCLYITTFKDSENEIITFDHTADTPYTVMANGIPYTITSTLKVIPGTHVFAIENGKCFYLQGTKGLLARICGRSVQIYAHQVLMGNIHGLCDAFTSVPSTTFTNRDHQTVVKKMFPNPEFPLSWLTPDQDEFCFQKTDAQDVIDLCKTNELKENLKRCKTIFKKFISISVPKIHEELCARDLCACNLGKEWECNKNQIGIVRHLLNV